MSVREISLCPSNTDARYTVFVFPLESPLIQPTITFVTDMPTYASSQEAENRQRLCSGGSPSTYDQVSHQSHASKQHCGRNRWFFLAIVETRTITLVAVDLDSSHRIPDERIQSLNTPHIPKQPRFMSEALFFATPVLARVSCKLSAHSPSPGGILLMDLQNCGTSEFRTIIYGCFIRLCSPCLQERYADKSSVRARIYLTNTLWDHLEYRSLTQSGQDRQQPESVPHVCPYQRDD